ncbi:L-glutamate gamma-semialdehyde dehydrogenase [Fibrella forsythiae]|uniref:L-glutamate gamma-semialdehyde dehydrogenase n=1 Tax=Fibrella forsythiae TaxID=2817061 RepID=A0ABS3JJM6_9BACT|nr:L-glutamate gamma-semialdehyde dehydrogenase [Fibrella forsythiae]MBO0950196.1 L-glutamate gamma-semialdehyde dehydrogenase [Fibrella forsythiae]
MINGITGVPQPQNEPVKEYRVGSPERKALQDALKAAKSEEQDLPMCINGKAVFGSNKVRVSPPHEHAHTLGYIHEGDASHVRQAIDAALQVRENWSSMPWEQRASIFLKAADLLAGPYRAKINAATMLGQSKNAYQAEIDSACEFIDFLRFNVHYMTEIYSQQPYSPPGVWNRLEYRALEGFVFALTPFNFTAIAGNLPTSAALMGNVVVWKPAYTQAYSAQVIMEVLQKSGLPDGVINLIYVDGPEAGEVIFQHPNFAGIHFTGSTGVFQTIWKSIGENISNYKTYPRIVGETGGKDYILVHNTADVTESVVAMIRGAFEYQGQKCSAASRAYVPASLWPAIKEQLQEELAKQTMGSVEDFSNLFNAVIDAKSFKKITSYIEKAKADGQTIVAGGNYSDEIGYFVEPTVIEVSDPKYQTMCDELFGPVLSVYVYDDAKLDEVVDLIDTTSPYALTGAILAKDRNVITELTTKLVNTAGNFYINDKPTGAVVGQQPFGGARASGTNDKAGSAVNLMRWVSMRTIKETLVSPRSVSYPFMEKDF